MTPEQEALMQQVLDDAELTEHLLSQPRFASMWKYHAWGFVNHLDIQDTVPRDKRTKSGWPPEVADEEIPRYIKFRVRELAPAKTSSTPTRMQPPAADKHVERLRALVNGDSTP